MTKCIGQISHYSQVDWSKNTCFGPLVKMDMSIHKKRPVNQFELFKNHFFNNENELPKITCPEDTTMDSKEEEETI